METDGPQLGEIGVIRQHGPDPSWAGESLRFRKTRRLRRRHEHGHGVPCDRGGGGGVEGGGSGSGGVWVEWWWLFPRVRRFLGECSTIHSPPALFFFLMEIISRTLIPFFSPESVHSGSASRDDCD